MAAAAVTTLCLCAGALQPTLHAQWRQIHRPPAAAALSARAAPERASARGPKVAQAKERAAQRKPRRVRLRLVRRREETRADDPRPGGSVWMDGDTVWCKPTDASAPAALLRGVSSHVGPADAAPTDAGLFLSMSGVSPRSEHRLTLGRLFARRWLAGAKIKRWWIGPSFGRADGPSDSTLPRETQYLLAELGPSCRPRDGCDPAGGYALLLPLVDGALRASLEGDGHASGASGMRLNARVEAGLSPDNVTAPARATGMDPMLLVACGDNPYALMKQAIGAAAARLGTFAPASAKTLPPELGRFGWCTWDAFYQQAE